MSKFAQPRDLNPSEKELLEFLLTADFPGRDSLKAQSRLVKAIGVCDCGCGTVDLAVPGEVSPVTGSKQMPVEAYGKGADVILFVRDGFLSCLEIVGHGDERSIPYPKPIDLALWVPPTSNAKD